MDNPPGPKSHHQIFLFFFFFFYISRPTAQYLLKSILSLVCVQFNSIPIRHQREETKQKPSPVRPRPSSLPMNQIIPPPLPPDPWSYRSRENALMMSRERHLTGDVTPPTTGQSRGILNPYIPSHTSHPIPSHPIPRASMMIYTRTRVG